MALTPGTKLGPYEIQSSIGAGGMGEVYRARDTRLGRDVAIKVLPAVFSNDAERLRRFEQEARAASSLNHPNILSIYDIGVAEDAPYVVSELLEGETLREKLRGGTLQARKVIDYAVQVCHGLASAHIKGIVHRDMKPENVFITKDGRVKILDFGLAKLIAPECSSKSTSVPTMSLQTEAGVVMGTVGYMSPEQVRGLTVDARSDLFALGCILYEMVSSKRAFSGKTAADTMSAVLKEDPPDLAGTDSHVSPALARAIGRCLEKDPEERFQSASDLGFTLESLSGTSSTATAVAKERVKPKSSRWTALILSAAALPAVAAYVLGGHMAARRDTNQVAFHPLTFRRGTLYNARFAPDGQTVVYAAAWDGTAPRLYMTRPDAPESRPMELTGGNLFGISPSGELAVSIGCTPFYIGYCGGTLAKMGLSGGGARPVLDEVSSADWSPDGKELAIVHETEGHRRVEFPIGKVIYDTTEGVSHVRVSPDGNMVALAVHPTYLNDLGNVLILDREGKTHATAGEWNSIEGLAWSPSGDEVWFASSVPTGAWADEIHALSRSGKQRLLLRLPGIIRIHDVSRDGRLLISMESWRSTVQFRGPNDSEEHDLSWLDYSNIDDMSPDGSTVVFSEAGEGPGASIVTYLRKTDASPAVLLGPGTTAALSPDRKWVLSVADSPNRLLLLPTGTGQTRTLEPSDIHDFTDPGWFPDSERAVFAGREHGKPWRLYAFDLAGGKPAPISPEIRIPGPYELQPLSPDGKFVWARDFQNKAWLYPVDGGSPHPFAMEPEDIWVNWGPDGGSAFVLRADGNLLRVYRINLRTGQRTLVKQVLAAERIGSTGINGMRMTPDGKSYAYSQETALSQLYLVTGVR